MTLTTVIYLIILTPTDVRLFEMPNLRTCSSIADWIEGERPNWKVNCIEASNV